MVERPKSPTDDVCEKDQKHLTDSHQAMELEMKIKKSQSSPQVYKEEKSYMEWNVMIVNVLR